ncbi:precorrin-6Y C5,15-methyltransferase (decarboxylating) subunit CbiT [Faecalicatena orotica]|uniref:precorrin-6Y C5,15-methyltransferase (decarboxylating) subunit CbiT n=1 Tax=Faecalicatena orotica TaxID=1544 RepID=UPI003216396F
MCKKDQTIYLIGIGMGAQDSLTGEALRLLGDCGCVIGARRMTEALKGLEKPVFHAYMPDEIRGYIEAHREYKKIAVALSGDPGFYSGAKKLEAELEGYEVIRVPGISSVVYLASRLHTSWEDAALVSAHGRIQNYIHAVAHNEKTFLLLGGETCGAALCEKLRYYGLEDVDCWIGRRLSYEDECIIHKKGSSLSPEDCSGLDVALILNAHPCRRTFCHVEDEEFIRGKVPMTKSEVRAVSMAKLQLHEDAVVYDIGAGTGSVAVEAAMQSGTIRVYAIEKNPEGALLIEENKKKFRTDWVTVVEGTAPEALLNLEAPTHVFIGGSSGNLKDILKTVKRKNPEVRIVLNAISLETVKEAIEAVEEGILKEPEIVQIAASRSRKLGAYHMMTGLNPVYIITEGKA